MDREIGMREGVDLKSESKAVQNQEDKCRGEHW